MFYNKIKKKNSLSINSEATMSNLVSEKGTSRLIIYGRIIHNFFFFHLPISIFDSLEKYS
jgi:hypothetical protein